MTLHDQLAGWQPINQALSVRATAASHKAMPLPPQQSRPTSCSGDCSRPVLWHSPQHDRKQYGHVTGPTSRSRDSSMLAWLDSRLSARRRSVRLPPGVPGLPRPSPLLARDSPLLRELRMLASWLALGTCLASTGARDLMATLVSRQWPRCTRPMEPSPISRMKCCTGQAQHGVGQIWLGPGHLLAPF